jgi:hypothetical protein
MSLSLFRKSGHKVTGLFQDHENEISSEENLCRPCSNPIANQGATAF